MNGVLTTKVMLIDDEMAGDRRVQRAAAELGADLVVIDLRTAVPGAGGKRLLLALRAFGLVIASGMAHPLLRYRSLRAALQHRLADGMFAGLTACFRWTMASLAAARQLRAVLDPSSPCVVYAHDLYCGLAATLLPLPPGSRVVYDAHELEILRNRKAGLLRVLLEHGLEHFVLSRVAEVRVVNHRIAEVMSRWYRMPALRVQYNDHYPEHAVQVPPPEGQPMLVYVGKGVRGRYLDAFAQATATGTFGGVAYLLGSEAPKALHDTGCLLGPDDYEPHLLDICRSRRCLMWCCLDPAPLSYRLATPNKFFQALALGIPVMASRGTYLAELVEQYGFGLVWNEQRVDDMQKTVMSKAFETWVRNVEAFRSALHDGEVKI